MTIGLDPARRVQFLTRCAIVKQELDVIAAL